MPTTSDRLRKQAKKVTKEIHKMSGAVKDAAQEKLRQIRQNGSDRYKQERGKINRAKRGVVLFIRDRPLQSALLAAGIGVVFGGLWLSRLTLARVHARTAT
jgi:ElaB/YqjD/DUF883 family membrane-anchored ribosome-binding protein